MPRFLIMGTIGSGKGTHGRYIANLFNIPFISTGDIFREEVKKGSELGQKVKGYLERGELVPDEIVINVVKQRLSQPDCEHGFVLDGFPRTMEQAKALDEITKIDLAIFLEVSEQTVMERLSLRRTCKNCGAVFNLKFAPPKTPGKCDFCGGELYQREDDKPEIIKKRLQQFWERTMPIIKLYEARGLLRRVNGEGDVEEVDKRIMELLKKEGFL